MAKLPEPIHISADNENSEVFVFGKPPELSTEDRRRQVARFGGMWRQPAYDRAYLQAASSLSKLAVLQGDLDQLGLPIFYLQRHALELLVKGLLHMMYDIADMRRQLETREFSGWLPSEGQRGRLKKEHKLSHLVPDLIRTSRGLGLDQPPKTIEEAVRLVERYEVEPTWARYPASQRGEPYQLKETVVPTMEMQKAVEKVFAQIGFDADDPSTFESVLYQEWSRLTSMLDDGDMDPS